MNLILVRHGETALNRKGDAEEGTGESAERIRGWLDVPLDDNGFRQAVDTARKLAGRRIDHVYASNLQRAYVTGQLIAAMTDAPIEPEQALRPWNVGRWSGRPVDEVLPKMKELISQHPEESAPGGEPFAAFVARFLTALRRMLGHAKTTDGDVCAVTHTRNLQLAKAWVAAGAPASFAYDPAVMDDYDNETGTGDFITLEPR
ncbi:MAG TPA: histidine phosphatase family protein [Polyangiaceae bacterium]|nr:histidine phosphatase family protein [Polyangiaceae bacterium]